MRAKKSGITISKSHGIVIGAVKTIDKPIVWTKDLNKKNINLFEKCFSLTLRYFSALFLLSSFSCSSSISVFLI